MGNLAPPFTGGPDPRRGVLPDVKGLERFIALADTDPEAARKLLADLAAKKFEPHPGQVPVMNAHERFLTMCAGRRFGKFLRFDQQLPTPSGFKQAGDVKVGDELFTQSGKPTKVTARFEHFDKLMYRLTFSDGATIECCSEHLWEVKNKNGRRARTLDTQTIARTFIKKRSDGKREHRWKLVRGRPVEYPEKQLPLPPYVVGALLGDGCLTGGPRLCANEYEIAERFRAEGMDLSKPDIRKNAAGGTTISYGIRKALPKLRELGLAGHGFATKFIPDAYMQGSINQRLDLLHGLMDTDGSVIRGRDNKGCMGEFSVGSKKLAEQTQELARSLAGWASITQRVTASGNLGWRVNIKLPLGVPLFWLKRKADLYQPRREPTRAIIKAEKLSNGDGVCFEVADQSALYYAGREYILTHNTKIAAALVLRKARRERKMVWWVAPTYKVVKRGYAEVLRQLPSDILAKPAPPETAFDAGRAVSLRFKNGSRLEFYSAERPEGMLGEGVDFAVLDEAATMPEHVWNQIVRPTLADHAGGALFISTPRGRNWFYKMYQRGQDELQANYASWRFPSMANPYIPAEEWEEMRETLPRAVYEQEILAEFISNAASVFRIPETGVAVIQKPEGHVVLGVDLAKHHDFTVLCGVNSGNRAPCFHDRFNAVSWPEQRQRIHRALEKIETTADSVTVMLDSTGIGDVVYDDLSMEGLDAIPIKFTPQWKQKAVMLLAADIERGEAFLHSDQVREFESYAYTITDAGRWKYEAASGNDDEVSAMLLAHWGVVNEGIPDIHMITVSNTPAEQESDPWIDDGYVDGEVVSEHTVTLRPPSVHQLLTRGF